MELYVLQVDYSFGGRAGALYPVLLKSGRELVLVDGGYAGFLPLIEAAAGRHGLSLQALTGILITHHDIDHLGGIPEIREKYPAAKVYASAAEAPYISGARRSLRLQQAEALYDTLPEHERPGARAFQQLLASARPVPVDVVLDEGPVAFLEGAAVLATPGHMPGHISVYLPESKTVVAADAVVFEQGALDIAHPAFTLDLAAAVASVEKLARLDLRRLVCYHGGVVEGDIGTRLQQLASRYKPMAAGPPAT